MSTISVCCFSDLWPLLKVTGLAETWMCIVQFSVSGMSICSSCLSVFYSGRDYWHYYGVMAHGKEWGYFEKCPCKLILGHSDEIVDSAFVYILSTLFYISAKCSWPRLYETRIRNLAYEKPKFFFCWVCSLLLLKKTSDIGNSLMRKLHLQETCFLSRDMLYLSYKKPCLKKVSFFHCLFLSFF